MKTNLVEEMVNSLEQSANINAPKYMQVTIDVIVIDHHDDPMPDIMWNSFLKAIKIYNRIHKTSLFIRKAGG